MPIRYDIDASRRLVVARPCGVLTAADMVAYHAEVWSRPDVTGCNELVDMRDVEQVAWEGRDHLRDFAQWAAQDDEHLGPGRIAIVAVSDLHYGLGRMYEMLREGDPRSRRKVRVFREEAEAYAWVAPRPTE